MQSENWTYNLETLLFLQLLPLIASAPIRINDNFVWLGWRGRLGQLQLDCYVKNLQLPLDFVLNNKERAHCTNIFPSSSCIPYDPNDSIHQSLTSNITTYTVRSFDLDLLNGRWFCSHGEYNSSSVVNFQINRNGAECCKIAYLSELSACLVSFLTATAVLQCTTLRNIPSGVKFISLSLLLLFLVLSPLTPYYLTAANYICTIGYAIAGIGIGPLLSVLIQPKNCESSNPGQNSPSEDRGDDGRTDDGRRDDSRGDEGRRDDGRRYDGRMDDGRGDDDRRDDGRGDDDIRDDGRRDDGRGDDGRRYDRRGVDSSRYDDRRDDGRRDDSRKDDGRADGDDTRDVGNADYLTGDVSFLVADRTHEYVALLSTSSC